MVFYAALLPILPQLNGSITGEGKVTIRVIKERIFSAGIHTEYQRAASMEEKGDILMLHPFKFIYFLIYLIFAPDPGGAPPAVLRELWILAAAASSAFRMRP